MNTKAKATNIKGGGAIPATLEELAVMPTPAPTKTWTPVPHVDVPATIDKFVAERGWGFVDGDNGGRYDIVVNQSLTKMFGVTKVIIPEVETDADFQMAIGFRNSHDKSMALRIAVGINVMVCSNLVITGDIQIRREHTTYISVEKTVELAFDRIPEAAQKLDGWFRRMRQIPLNLEHGVAFLAQAVEARALPIGDFMDARGLWIGGCAEGMSSEETQIDYPGTLWAAYQAVTCQFKKHSLNRTQDYGVKLNKVVANYTS